VTTIKFKNIYYTDGPEGHSEDNLDVSDDLETTEFYKQWQPKYLDVITEKIQLRLGEKCKIVEGTI